MLEKQLSRRHFMAGVAGAMGAGALLTNTAAAQETPVQASAGEIIRVAPDQWTFQGAQSGAPFVPFGANMVLPSKKELNLFSPENYNKDRYAAILAAAAGVNINLLKVFLPIGAILPDPQAAGSAAVAPGYLKNLEEFLGLCTAHGVRAVVTLSEWGGGKLDWWRDGGQYFGRTPWSRDPGTDSLDVICQFWRLLCERLRGNPAVFSYTPCVEWSMPNPNLSNTFNTTEEERGQLPGDTSLWYWREWLRARYDGDVSALNKSWGTALNAFEEAPIASYAYDGGAKAYRDPENRILDYQNFKEWTTMRYMRPQLDAIRAADDTHMATISNHMLSWNLWEGAAFCFLGYTGAEESPYVDYLTHHANYDQKTQEDQKKSLDQPPIETAVLARMTRAGQPRPVMVEEFNFACADPQETARRQEAMVRETVGHVSGWMTWYLCYPSDASSVVDSAYRSSWLNDDLTPTPWGLAAKALHDDLVRGSLARIPAQETIALERAVELVPKKTGKVIEVLLAGGGAVKPVDFVIAHEPLLDLRLANDGGPGARLCRPVVSGNLRPFDPSLDRAAWDREMDDERGISFDLLWLSHIGPGLDSPADKDNVLALLDICAARGMQVILDVGSTHDWYGTLDVEQETARAVKQAKGVAERYGQHPAFFGWYIPHEIYMCWDAMGRYIEALYPRLVETCKKAVDKPVTLSPFFLLDRDKVFGDFRYAEPDEYAAYWEKLIRVSAMDIIMLQDSGEHFAYVTMTERQPFFAAMHQACAATGAKLWGNVEVAEFNCPTKEEYVQRYGKVHHCTVKNAPWRAVPIDRLGEKLRLAATYCERIVSWGYSQYGRPSISPEAAAWYASYKDYVSKV